MKVCIDDVLTVECSHLLNMGETWNGFVQPVFTAEQVVTLVAECERAEFGDVSDQVHDIGGGEFVTYGWTWQVC